MAANGHIGPTTLSVRTHLLAGLGFMLLLSLLTPQPAARAQDLIVSAAASLTDAFRAIEPAFETAHPGIAVVMNFAASGALYRQIEQGAPVDVFASANPKWMQQAVEKGFITRTAVVDFARNTLVLAAPADNPAGLGTLSDLTAVRVTRIGIGNPATVPAGQYARAALAGGRLFADLSPKLIYCESVRQVLDYLVRGEVDGGFVYRTDVVRGGPRVRAVAQIALENPVTYPIAVLKESAAPEAARAFVSFVLSKEGRVLLAAGGFQPAGSSKTQKGGAP